MSVRTAYVSVWEVLLHVDWGFEYGDAYCASSSIMRVTDNK